MYNMTRKFVLFVGQLYVLIAVFQQAVLGHWKVNGTQVNKLRWKYKQEVLKLMSQAISPSPAISMYGIIYFCWGTTIFSVSNNGTLLWSHQITADMSSGIVESSPVVSLDNTVYVAAGKSLYSLKYDKGDISSWYFQTDGAIKGSPLITHDGTIYVSSLDMNIYAISADTHKLKWSYTTQGGIVSTPAIDKEGSIYVTSLDNLLYKLSNQGRLMWTFNATGKLYASPVVAASELSMFKQVYEDDDVVFVVSGEPVYKLYAVSSHTGRELWVWIIFKNSRYLLH